MQIDLNVADHVQKNGNHSQDGVYVSFQSVIDVAVVHAQRIHALCMVDHRLFN